MLQKIIDCRSLKVSHENVYDKGYFSKVTSFQRKDYTSTVKRLQCMFKKNILKKKPLME